jgi:hypothetical protein
MHLLWPVKAYFDEGDSERWHRYVRAEGRREDKEEATFIFCPVLSAYAIISEICTGILWSDRIYRLLFESDISIDTKPGGTKRIKK